MGLINEHIEQEIGLNAVTKQYPIGSSLGKKGIFLVIKIIIN
jgi:hypothetical protein